MNRVAHSTKGAGMAPVASARLPDRVVMTRWTMRFVTLLFLSFLISHTRSRNALLQLFFSFGIICSIYHPEYCVTNWALLLTSLVVLAVSLTRKYWPSVLCSAVTVSPTLGTDKFSSVLFQMCIGITYTCYSEMQIYVSVNLIFFFPRGNNFFFSFSVYHAPQDQRVLQIQRH